MLMNIVLVYANLSATTDKNVSGQKADCSGPCRQRLPLIACCLALSRASLFDNSKACRPDRQLVLGYFRMMRCKGKLTVYDLSRRVFVSIQHRLIRVPLDRLLALLDSQPSSSPLFLKVLHLANMPDEPA